MASPALPGMLFEVDAVAVRPTGRSERPVGAAGRGGRSGRPVGAA
ncbi:hypothetical protein [Streptomyces collinus]